MYTVNATSNSLPMVVARPEALFSRRLEVGVIKFLAYSVKPGSLDAEE